MSLAPRTCLGPYEIVAPIGAGGMGEVYKAKDTRLDRIVAIKVLPDHLASDPELKQRFEREAKTISSLNHPHICTLYEFDSQDGTDFLVMEYLEGETLADRLSKGALPLEQALRYAIQISDALDKAHLQGVVHRDLKPGNIMLTKTGAKLLDFGLAKLSPGVRPNLSSLSAAPTQEKPITAKGTVLGTVQYMAPEQLEGKEADARTDLFAFGAVVYEMVTGKKAFEGKSQLSVMTAILENDPAPVSSTQSMSPKALDHVVKTCLEKEPDNRWHSAGDIARQLTWIAGGSEENAVASAEPIGWRRAILMSVGASLVVGLIAAPAVGKLNEQPAKAVSRFVIPVPESAPLEITVENTDVAISPDGSTIVYVATSGRQLFVRSLDQLEATPLRGTEGGYSPFFSPDGEWIGYRNSADGTLSKVSVRGGPPLVIHQLPPNDDLRGASWGADGTIIFGTRAAEPGLQRVSAAGGEPVDVTTPDADHDEVDHAWPDILPGGQAVLFTVFTGSDIETPSIAVFSFESGERKELIRGGSHPRYLPTGHIVYGVENTLRAVPFDLETLEVHGNPVPVLESVITKRGGAADFSFAANGSLVYISGSASSTLRTLVWTDREGREDALAAVPQTYSSVSLSPDGTLAAVVVRRPGRDVWIYDLARETFTRLTFEDSNLSPIWTPDGLRVVFRSNRDGGGIFSKAADGAGGVERLVDQTYVRNPQGFHPDGKRLLVGQNNAVTLQDIGVISIDDNGSEEWIAKTEFQEARAAMAPNGKWVAYSSNESGGDQIYVRPFPPGDAGRWQVSTDEGVAPLWSRDGRELFYVGPRGMMAVPVETEPSFRTGTPELLFSTASYLVDARRPFDISPDSQRFLMLKESGENPDAAQIHVVLNWFEELERLVPTDN